MGTNYYYKNNNGEIIHIGKLSSGWKFHLAFNSFKNHIYWKRELKNREIYSDYGKIWTYNEFIAMIESNQYIIEPEPNREEKLLMYTPPRFKPININGYIFIKGRWS